MEKLIKMQFHQYVGLDRFEARKKILNELKEKDYFVKRRKY